MLSKQLISLQQFPTGTNTNSKAGDTHWFAESGHHWCSRHWFWKDVCFPYTFTRLDSNSTKNRKVLYHADSSFV